MDTPILSSEIEFPLDSIKYVEKLVKSSDSSYLYLSPLYPDINVQLYYSDVDMKSLIITAECNLVYFDQSQIIPLFLKVNGDLDELLKLIDQEYGQTAPGFDDKDSDREYVEPVFRHINWTPDRRLTIYTWGKKYRKYKPDQSRHNFNAGIINGHRKGMNLKKITGLNPDVQKAVKSGKGYIKFMEEMITKIETENLHVISINCTAGRHRSVSCAEILKREFYPNTVIHHLELH